MSPKSVIDFKMPGKAASICFTILIFPKGIEMSHFIPGLSKLFALIDTSMSVAKFFTSFTVCLCCFDAVFFLLFFFAGTGAAASPGATLLALPLPAQ